MAYEYTKEPYEKYEVLVDLYWNQTMSLKDVGDELGVGHWRIQTEMERQGIPRRPSGDTRDWTNVSLSDYREELRQEEAAQRVASHRETQLDGEAQRGPHPNEEYRKLTWTDMARL